MDEKKEINIPQNETTEEKQEKVRKWPFILLAVVFLLGFLVITGIWYFKSNFDYNYNEITKVPEQLGFEEVIEEKVINIALFGIDTRNEKSFKGRSDSIMIMSLNTKTKQIKLISVLRDSFVPVDKASGTVYTKLNHAYSMGGPELAIKTLNKVFDLDISEYATVNFSGMADIIDAVGGVDVDVTESEVKYINGGVSEHCKILGIKEPSKYYISSSGRQHLNGIQAVAYSRIRYTANASGTSNDYGRTDRQRYVLGQLFNKALTLDKSQYKPLIKALMPCCETSLSTTEILDLALKVLTSSPTFSETRVPSTDYTMRAPTTSAGSIAYYDLNFAAKLIHAFIYKNITPSDYIAQNGVEKNNWYINGYAPIDIQDDEITGTQNENSNDSVSVSDVE